MASNSIVPIQPKRNQSVLTGIAFLICAGCTFEQGPRTKSATTTESIVVRTVSVMQEEVQPRTTQPATLHAFYRAEIRSKVTGYIIELNVDIGDHVAQGDPLMVLDVPELNQQQETMAAKVRRAEAEEKRALAGVQLATARVQSAEAKLAQANSEMNRADASLAAAEAEFSRTLDLVQRQSLQQRMLDEVRKKRDSELAAKQSVASAIVSAEADVTVSRAELSSAQADQDVATAQTEIARSQLEELQVLINYAVLKAPFSGVVTSRDVDLGDLVLADSQGTKGSSLFSISQIDKLRIQIPVPEADAALVNPGDAVTVRFPSFQQVTPMQASVTRLSGSLDPSTRTMLVEAMIENPEMKLIPGMFGEATISMGAKIASHVLPARAVRFDESGNAFVYAIGDDEIVEVIGVTTGMDDGHTIEITTGLEPGQRVVDAHLKRLATGQKVTILTP